MKSPIYGPRRIKGLMDNYRPLAIVAALLIFSFYSNAQTHANYDSNRVIQVQSSYGFEWGVGSFKKGLIIPNDTPKLAYKDSNAIANKGLNMYKWTGTTWTAISGGGGSGTDPLKRFISDTTAQTGTATNFSTRKNIDSITNNYNKTKQLLWHKGTLVDSSVNGQITFDGNFIASHDTVFSAYRAGVNFSITDSTGADGRTYKVMRSTGGGGGTSIGGRFTTNGYGTIVDSSTANLYRIIADTNTTAKLRDAAINGKLNTLIANAVYGTHFGFSSDSLKLYLIAANGTKLDSATFTGATAGGGGAGTVTGGTITWPGTSYSTPTAGTVTSGNLNFSPALANQSAFTLLGNNTSGSTTPSFFTPPTKVKVVGKVSVTPGFICKVAAVGVEETVG